YKDRQKVKAALARRGFDFDSIDEALRMLARQADDEWDE
ncbi:MAG: RecX family transcriptional regulator, partial [Clostridia bacterium]|nr:RecX family transcriptional regulator [Clostridia bacterium]